MPLEQLQKINPAFTETRLEGDYNRIVAKMFKLVIGISIVQPGDDFKTHSGFSGLKCNFKQQEGLLFPLMKSLIFIKKPVISIRYEDIARVEFQRVNGSVGVRNFDFKIILRRGPETEFTSADRKDFEALKELFIKRNVEVKEEDDRKGKSGNREDDYAQDEDEEEGGSIHSEGEEEDGEEEEDEDFVEDEEEGMEENEDYNDKKKAKKR